MKNKLFKILIILFSLFLSIFILFLFKPTIFFNNIDYLIKNKFIDNLSGNLNFTNYYGNFIKGFTLENISYEANNTHFSAKRIYIDPDLLNFHRYTTFIKERSSKIRNFISSTLEIQEYDYKDEDVEV